MLDSAEPSPEALLSGILRQVAPENDKNAFPDDVTALAVRRMG
jgi:hypothetical protein